MKDEVTKKITDIANEASEPKSVCEQNGHEAYENWLKGPNFKKLKMESMILKTDIRIS